MTPVLFHTQCELSIPDFCDMDRFDKMMRDWSNATGLATVAIGKDGSYLTGYYNFTDFCQKLTRKSPEGLRRCIECDKKGRGVYLCHAGLVDFAAPITLEDGTLLGNIIGGQVLPSRPSEKRFRETARQLGINEDRYIEELRKVNIRSKEEIQASFDLLTATINMFVRTSYAEKQNSQSLRERADIISSLSTIYFCDYFLDLEANTALELDATTSLHQLFAPLLGLKADEALRRAVPLIVLPEAQKEFTDFIDLSTLTERIDGRSSISFEFPSIANGYCRALFIPVKRNESGQAFQVIFALQDVSEEKKKELETQQTLRIAADDANRANRAKTDFLSRMSHDIRTPLNGIVGMTYLASQEKNPEKTQDYLHKIDTSSRFLLGLINDVLDMAKVESQKITLHPEIYPLPEFVNYLNSVIAPLCVEKNVHFTYQTNLPEGYYPLMDKLRINQILFNLLSNAVKFTPEGGEVIYRANFELLENDSKLRMTATVQDNGVGMSEDFLKTLFTPFSQEGRCDTSANRGAGLGLAICKHLVDLMNGTITAESQLGKGSLFTLKIDFPAEKIGANIPAKTLSSTTEISLAGSHILLCEDHPLNQEIARKLLESKGAIVDIANNGDEGLKAFRLSAPNYFDAILMDIRMPVMDGYEATKRIRSLSRPDAHQVPIVAMTADAFADDVAKCLAVGMNAHLAKPIQPALMFKTLQNVIASSKQ